MMKRLLAGLLLIAGCGTGVEDAAVHRACADFTVRFAPGFVEDLLANQRADFAQGMPKTTAAWIARETCVGFCGETMGSCFTDCWTCNEASLDAVYGY